MLKDLMENNLQIAIEAAKNAAVYLRNNEGKSVINESNGKDIKLQSDIDSEKIIFETLRMKSNIEILSEEAGYIRNFDNQGLRWIIDPLDGSLNYSRGLPLNCVSIALWKYAEPILGVIYDFNRDLIYTGIVGKGASCNGDPIFVSDVHNKSESILCTGFPVYTSHDSNDLVSFVKDIQVYKKVRLLGSAALSLAYVARGSVEAYRENNIAIWDVAAGIAIVLAAGGKAEFEFTLENGTIGNVYVSNFEKYQ